MNRCGIILLSGALTLLPVAGWADAQTGAVTGVVTTRVVLDQVRSSLMSALNSARVAGDYLLAKALMQALSAIDAWERANQKLIDQAFERVDQTRVATLNDLRAVLAQGTLTASQLSVQADRVTLTAEDLLTRFSLQPPIYITRYTPEVIAPTEKGNDPVLIRIQGVRLDKGKLSVNLPGAKLSVIGPRELLLSLPRSALKFNSDNLTLNQLPITHRESTLWGSKTITRTLPVMTLPSQVGTVAVETRVKVNAVKKQIFTLNLGQFKGQNEDQFRIVSPPQDWLWNIGNTSEFQLKQGGADNGRCESIHFADSTNHGVKIHVRLDERRVLIGSKDAYVNCTLVGEAYQTYEVVETTQLPVQKLNWWEGMAIQLPPSTSLQGLTVTFKTFDGKSYVFSGSERTPYADFRLGTDQLLVNPILPSTF